MTSTSLPGKEFGPIFSQAAKAAKDGPLFVTEQGETAFVLLNFQDYRRLIREHRSMAELLAAGHGPMR